MKPTCPKCKAPVEKQWGVAIENPDTEKEEVIRYWYCLKCKIGGELVYELKEITQRPLKNRSR